MQNARLEKKTTPRVVSEDWSSEYLKDQETKEITEDIGALTATKSAENQDNFSNKKEDTEDKDTISTKAKTDSGNDIKANDGLKTSPVQNVYMKAAVKPARPKVRLRQKKDNAEYTSDELMPSSDSEQEKTKYDTKKYITEDTDPSDESMINSDSEQENTRYDTKKHITEDTGVLTAKKNAENQDDFSNKKEDTEDKDSSTISTKAKTDSGNDIDTNDDSWKTSLVRNVHMKAPVRPARPKVRLRKKKDKAEYTSDEWMPSSDSDSEPENTKYNKKTQIKLTVQTMAESSSAEHIAIENRKFMPKLPSSQGVKASEEDTEADKDSESEEDKIHFCIDKLQDEDCSEEIIVDTAKKSDVGKRRYDKKNSCFYCTSMLSKIGRHILTVHKDEEEVSRILATTKNKSRERKIELELLRKKGNFHHNMKVRKVGGTMQISRRPSSIENASHAEYLPCRNCLTFVKKGHLWRHNKSCSQRRPNEPSNRKRQYEAMMLVNPTEDKDKAKFMEDIVSHMRMDDKGIISKSDDTIMRYGLFLYESSGPSKRPYISQKMRILSRLLIEVRKITGQHNARLTSFLAPMYFDDILKGTKLLTAYALNEDSPPEMQTPSLALKIGYALDKVAALDKGYAVRLKDKNKIDDLDDFIHLMESEWSTRISAVAINTMAENNYNKVEVLPITEDLLVLRTHTVTRLKELPEELRIDEANIEAFRELAEVTVARIVVINRRRSTEGAKLTIDQFRNRPKWNQNSLSEIQESLTPLEVELCKRLDLVYIRGKRGRKVPIMLTADVIYAIQCLIRTRVTVGVNKDNKYIFAAPTRDSKSHLRGHDCLANVVARCKLKCPQGIKSTKLRKYAATVSQILDLKNNEIEWLAGHMGHDLNVHKEYYRLQDHTIELAKVSKLLLALDEGNGKDLIGKKLSDITLQGKGCSGAFLGLARVLMYPAPSVLCPSSVTKVLILPIIRFF